jgi:hypothetical protein
MERLNKLTIVKANQLDKNNTYISVDNNSWKSTSRVSLSDIILAIQTDKLSEQVDNISIVADPETGKLRVMFPTIEKQTIFCEPFENHDISVNRLPKNRIDISALHFSLDYNFLYIWIENLKKWKRIPLSEWL